jgi:hypothetical protein
MIDSFIRTWFLISPTELPTNFEELKSGLLPNIDCRSVYEVERLQSKPGKDRPYLPLGEYLGAGLAYDLPEFKTILNHDGLKEAGVGFDDAFRAACDNLRAKSQQGFVSCAPGVWWSPWRDNYDASRLLLPDLIRRHPVRGTHLAMVPNRDLLLVTGSEDEAGMGVMASLAEEALGQPWALSGLTFLLDGDSWHPVGTPEGHSHHRQFQLLRYQAFAHEYSEQRQPLKDFYLAKGEDVFVGNYFAAEEPNSGQLYSYAMLTVGLDTLLPLTDRVGFAIPKAPLERGLPLDFDRMPPVPLTRFREVAGYCLEPLDVFPRRFRVRTFPSPKDLDVLRKYQGPSDAAPWCVTLSSPCGGYCDY